MLFSEKWLRNHQKFLLHFLIHIDVLMLCRKFELIPTKTFRITAILLHYIVYCTNVLSLSLPPLSLSPSSLSLL